MPEHRHNNSSLVRAIRSQTGRTEFPHVPYSLVPYDADIYGPGSQARGSHGYGAVPAWLSDLFSGGEEAESTKGKYTSAEEAKKNGGNVGKASWVSGAVSGAGELLGGLGGSWIEGKYGQQVAAAQIESNERIAMAQMQSNQQAQAAQNDGSGDAAGMGTGTKVALSLSVLALLGGTGYYFYRRRS